MRTISLLIITLALSACASEDETSNNLSTEPFIERQEGAQFAYEHSMTIELPPGTVNTKIRSITSACVADEANQCEILEASTTDSRRPEGGITLRIAPAGVQAIKDMAALDGTITNSQVRAKDLAEPIADVEARLQQQQNYLTKLQALEQEASSDIDSLIKVTAEISKVQSDIETYAGQLAVQNQRVNTEILNLRFFSEVKAEFLSPIAASMRGFKEDISEGIASVITGAAYVIPWLLFFIPVLLLFRKLWAKPK